MDYGAKLKIGDAGAKGRGVFADACIHPGDLVYDYGSDGGGEEQWIFDIPQESWEFTFQVDYDRYILPPKESPGWFLNHSCEPSCVIMGRTRIVALREISRGEEITIDYSTNVGWDGFSLKCSCGSPHCRGVIRSYHYLSKELRGRYGACVSSFLLRRS